MKFRSHWSDPTWRMLRIASFVTAGITLLFLVIVLLGANSWRYPLAVAVIANIIVQGLLVFTHYELRGE